MKHSSEQSSIKVAQNLLKSAPFPIMQNSKTLASIWRLWHLDCLENDSTIELKFHFQILFYKMLLLRPFWVAKERVMPCHVMHCLVSSK